MPSPLLLDFSFPKKATLTRRRNRFLGDVILDDDVSSVVHVPNTGSLLGVLDDVKNGKPQPALLSEIRDPKSKRKYVHTLEAVSLDANARTAPVWVGINTQNPNRLFRNLWQQGFFPWKTLQSEFTVAEGCRFDFLGDAALDSDGNSDHKPTLIEIKNVSMVEQKDGVTTALFPDCKSERALKHLRTMENLVREGRYRGEVFFLIQRPDPTSFRPAHSIDKAFGQKLTSLVQEKIISARALTFEILPGNGQTDCGIRFFSEVPVLP